MTTKPDPRNHNAHVVAYVQNKYCTGSYKPLEREYREARS